MDFGSPDVLWGDGCAPMEQVAAARTWFEASEPAPLEGIVDYTRQLNVWDDDLRPDDHSPEAWYLYFVEATNLLAMAVNHDGTGGPYGTWSAPLCAARAVVCAFKTMWRPGVARADDALALIDAARALAT